MKNFLVTIINALVLIIIGIYGYSISGSGTALIAPVIGVVLFILAFPVKNQNPTFTHIAVSLTALTFIVFLIIGFIRHNILIHVMALVSLIATVFYVMDFIKRKKEREANKVNG